MTDKEIEQLWEDLEDILFVEDKSHELVLNEPWLHFEAGTDRESIWHWFDETYSKGIGWLMYEAENDKQEENIMTNTKECLNCGHEQQTEGRLCKDSLGDFLICERCDSSFDVEVNEGSKH